MKKNNKKNNKKSVDFEIKEGVDILHDDITKLMNGLIESCIRLKQILITVMYTVNNPEIMAKIQEATIKIAMKHEISHNNPPEDVVNNFLDYLNTTKSY